MDKMDGNHSILNDGSLWMSCEMAWIPFTLNAAFGLPANMGVIWLILEKSGFKEILTLNQAVSEVVISMTNIVLLIAINPTLNNMCALFCYIFRFMLGFIFLGRPIFMSIICLERYLAVVHPVAFLRYKPIRYRLAVAIGSWLTVLVCSTIMIWIPEPDLYYVLFGIAFPWFLVKLFCCVETLRALVRPGPGEESQGSNKMSNVKLNAVKVIMIIIVASAVNNLSYTLSVILFGHISSEDTSKMFCVSNYTAMIIWFIPPLLYYQRVGRWQLCIKDAV